MRIVITGDTHIPSRGHEVPAKICQEARKSDLVIHTGDFNSVEAYRSLAQAAPELRAVRGNQDVRELAKLLPTTERFAVDGLRFVVTHGHTWGRPRPSRLAREFAREADVVVYGHLHRPTILPFHGCTVINPGSPVDPRGGRPCYVVAFVEDGELHAELRYIS